MFESCVVLDGNQTLCFKSLAYMGFESCVVLDGNQTSSSPEETEIGLRVVLF